MKRNFWIDDAWLRTSFVSRTSIIAPNRPSVHIKCNVSIPASSRRKITTPAARPTVKGPRDVCDRAGTNAPLILSGPYSSPIRFRKDAYKSRDGPVAWEHRAARGARVGTGGSAGGGGHNTKMGRTHTIARWKSGFPLAVVAKSVNCETQRTSPSMSLTFFFHIAPDPSSEKTLSDRLRVRERGRAAGKSARCIKHRADRSSSEGAERRRDEYAAVSDAAHGVLKKRTQTQDAHLFGKTFEVGHGIVCPVCRRQQFIRRVFLLNGYE